MRGAYVSCVLPRISALPKACHPEEKHFLQPWSKPKLNCFCTNPKDKLPWLLKSKGQAATAAQIQKDEQPILPAPILWGAICPKRQSRPIGDPPTRNCTKQELWAFPKDSRQINGCEWGAAKPILRGFELLKDKKTKAGIRKVKILWRAAYWV